MKYETPEVTVLTPAVDAIQAMKITPNTIDSNLHEVGSSAYEDWE
jgi:hypothetical protein